MRWRYLLCDTQPEEIFWENEVVNQFNQKFLIPRATNYSPQEIQWSIWFVLNYATILSVYRFTHDGACIFILDVDLPEQPALIVLIHDAWGKQERKIIQPNSLINREFS